MPGGDGSLRRLDSLLDDLFADRPSEAADILADVSRLVTPRNRSLVQGRIASRLRAMTAFTPQAAVKAACAMHVSGVPAHRLVHFLSTSLPGPINLSQFELTVRFIFDDDPPLSPQLLYDITQYTYLEEKLLARRSVELAERLRGSLTAKVLLYLYLLSLRDDLSNENIHLILLILRICFPALKVRGRSRGISAAEAREVAEAWKSAQKSARYAQLVPPLPRAVAPPEREARESASYFLDKYFSSEVREKPPEQRITFTSSSARGGTPRAAKPDSRPRSKVRTGSRATRGPAASLPPGPRSAGGRPGAPRGRAPFLRLAPFALAAALVSCLVFADIARLSSLAFGFRGTESRPAATVPAGQTAFPAATPAPVVQEPVSHVVEHGDSLWKIYRSLGREKAGWNDFVRITKEQNGLRNPDLIFPGNVLSITTGSK